MITREAIRELAAFASDAGCAVSFYFQPLTPTNKSHHQELIQAKDLARQALREAEKHGKNACARADLERVLALAEQLHGNHARAKAVFACGGRGLWQEFDLPPRLARSQLFLGHHFHLRPLLALLDTLPRCGVVVADGKRARIFEVVMDQLAESSGMVTPITRRKRSDGFMGYEAGHAQRRIEDDELHHFKQVGERLKHLATRGGCELLALGCREETWRELEPQLHTYVKQRMLGRFTADPVTATHEQVRSEVQRLLAEQRARRSRELLREVLGEAQRNGRGAVGLRNVLRSLERGEVQAVLLAEDFAGRASECRACGRLDSRLLPHCAVCGQETRTLADVGERLLGQLLRGGIELLPVAADPALEKAGGIAALLRFRADQSTPRRLAV
jgi:peptide subunit release factor 1 (eRF1)